MNDENEKFTLDVDVASAVKAAFCAAGWDNELLRRLLLGDHLRKLRSVVEGHSEIAPKKFFLNLLTPPTFRIGGQNELTLESHAGPFGATLTREGDRLFFDGKRINLFVCKAQRKGCFTGQIEKAVAKMNVVNANLGIFLAHNPFMIPTPWFSKYREIILWGTRYKNIYHGQYVVTLNIGQVGEARLGYLHVNRGEDGGCYSSDYPSAVIEP